MQMLPPFNAGGSLHNTSSDLYRLRTTPEPYFDKVDGNDTINGYLGATTNHERSAGKMAKAAMMSSGVGEDEFDNAGRQALHTAIHVLQTEAEALMSLKQLYAQHPVAKKGFTQAVAGIAASQKAGGKLVVVGVGKSGKIGKKMESTMNSLGLLSMFLNPVEALHGDLGILRPVSAALPHYLIPGFICFILSSCPVSTFYKRTVAQPFGMVVTGLESDVSVHTPHMVHEMLSIGHLEPAQRRVAVECFLTCPRRFPFARTAPSPLHGTCECRIKALQFVRPSYRIASHRRKGSLSRCLSSHRTYPFYCSSIRPLTSYLTERHYPPHHFFWQHPRVAQPPPTHPRRAPGNCFDGTHLLSNSKAHPIPPFSYPSARTNTRVRTINIRPLCADDLDNRCACPWRCAGPRSGESSAYSRR